MRGSPPPTELLDELAAAHAAEVAALATLVLQHRDGVEEVVIDAIVDAARDPRRPPAGPQRRRFMLRLARQRVLAAQRRSSTVDPLLVLGARSPGAEENPAPGRGIPLHDLATAMAELPARSRALIALRYALDLSDAELGEVMDAPPDRVARQANEAAERLRRRLEGGEALTVIEEIVGVD